MRVRVWWMGRKDDNAVDMVGPPWIERKENPEEGPFVMCSLGGALPENNQLRVKFLESEWPIIKARIDAAFAGEDPNPEKFYSGEPKRSSRS